MTEVRNEVLARDDRPDLRVYLVWVPMMGADAAAAEHAAQRIVDPRVTQFWDGDGVLGNLYGRALAIPGRAGEEHGFGWDLYLAYAPGVVWSDPAPAHEIAMAGLMTMAPGLGLEVFDGTILGERIAAIPAATQ